MEYGSPSNIAATYTATTTTEDIGVTAPGPTQTGISDICNKWIMQKKDKYCQDMADEAGTSLDCFYEMNPALSTKKGECQGLIAGYAYCIGTSRNMYK